MAEFEPSPTGYVAIYDVFWPHLKNGETDVIALPVIGYEGGSALILGPAGQVYRVDQFTWYYRDVPCKLALVRPVMQLIEDDEEWA